jgi:hypothetical protein
LRGAVVHPDWTVRTADIAGTSEGLTVGLGCDIAINDSITTKTDRLAVVFYVLADAVNGGSMPTLYYGETRELPTEDTGSYPLTWTLRPALNSQANAGRFCSVIYGEDNTIHTAFYDAANLAPGYATISESGTLSGGQLIESSLFLSSGQETSIAINPETGRPAVAYYDITNAALRFAQMDQTGQWTTVLIDGDGDTATLPCCGSIRPPRPCASSITIRPAAACGGQPGVLQRPMGIENAVGGNTRVSSVHGAR